MKGKLRCTTPTERRGLMVLFIALFVSLLFKAFLLNNLPIKEILSGQLFISLMFNKPVEISWVFVQFIDLVNIILVYKLAKMMFGSISGGLAALVYSISPWLAYYSLSGSIVIVLMFFTLIGLIELIKYRENKETIDLVIFTLAITLPLLVSIMSWFLLPFWIVALFVGGKKKTSVCKSITVLVVGAIFLVVMFLINKQAVLNEYKQAVGIFSNPGLINAVNTFRGQASESGLYVLARMVDNKYTYLSRIVFFNFIDHFSPVVYFAPQVKLLGFSFSPPIYFALIIPFILGFKKLLSFLKKHNYLFIIIVALFIPSVLSSSSPDMQRLLLIFPFFAATISIGILKGFQSQKFYIKYLTYFSVLLTIIQIFIMLSDVATRESSRAMMLLNL